MIYPKRPFQTLRDGAVRSQLVALSAALAVALVGHVENGDGVAALNAISHIAFGEESFEKNELSLKYTGAAFLLNQISVTGWALGHEWLFGGARDQGKRGVSLAGGALVAALAYLVDFKLAPDRYKPGFERKLSRQGLLAVYVMLALALGWGKKR